MHTLGWPAPCKEGPLARGKRSSSSPRQQAGSCRDEQLARARCPPSHPSTAAPSPLPADLTDQPSTHPLEHLTCRTARLGAGSPRFSCGKRAFCAADSRPSALPVPAPAAAVAAAAPSMKRPSAWLAAWRSARSSAGVCSTRGRWRQGCAGCTAKGAWTPNLKLPYPTLSALQPAPHPRCAGRAGTCAAAGPPAAQSWAARRLGGGASSRPCGARSPARQSLGKGGDGRVAQAVNGGGNSHEMKRSIRSVASRVVHGWLAARLR